MKNKLAPDYPRIAHLKGISKLYDDDIEIDPSSWIMDAYVQEKVDGANCGVSWSNDGPLLRNRDHILNKGYSKIKTPAKKQFVPAWNWLHSKEDDIKEVMKRWEGPVTIYGEWLFLKHSLEYDKLPDLFLAYDIWSSEFNKFISPSKCEMLLEDTGIKWIKANRMKFNSKEDILDYANKPSDYRTGIREGIVLKIVDEKDMWITSVYKLVRGDFERAGSDWNKTEMMKNKIIR